MPDIFREIAQAMRFAFLSIAILLSVPGAIIAASARAEPPADPRRILSAYGGAYDDQKLHDSLSRTVGRLIAASGRPDLRYRITILNSPAVTSFALPDGQLYVTRGLLAVANDSAEVASALSHDIAHVIARHAAINDAPGGTQEDVSRAQEIEADTLGIGIAARAGFDPYGAARLLHAMARNAELHLTDYHTGSVEFMSSHAATPERVENARAAADRVAATGVERSDRAAYLAGLNGMTYGSDGDDGFVRGRRFIHPRRGFTFMAPEGFTLQTAAQTVRGSNESADRTLKLDIVKIPAGYSLVEYLNSGWIDLEDGSVEELAVNGMPAATASAAGDPWYRRIYIVRPGGDELCRLIFAAKNFDPKVSADSTREADRSFFASIQTFRRLSQHESAARPLRLKVVKVRAGDTVESLAAAMAFDDHQVERFQVLNGLDSGADLKAGESVKIVVE
jgi:predicted Zn-dependent protease